LIDFRDLKLYSAIEAALSDWAAMPQRDPKRRVNRPAAGQEYRVDLPKNSMYVHLMGQLADIQKQAKELSEEDREGLVAFLLHGFTSAPSGPDDEEVRRRDADMDSGAVKPISHAEFLAQVGRSAT
jgi:hypothetical protein